MRSITLTSLLPKFLVVFLFLFTFNSLNAQYDVATYELIKNNPEAFRSKLKANPTFQINLRGADLRGLDLSQMSLIGADFSYCQLEGVSFKESDLTNASFIGAKIMKADFSRANLTSADLNKTNATGAVFKESMLKNTITQYLMIQDGYQLNPAYITTEGLVAPIIK
jgi:uncharacterized protein YjbI with pentapeptide repeats